MTTSPTTPQGAEPREDGWIEWTGGENPVPGQMVLTRTKVATTPEPVKSEWIDWCIVIAYRVVSPQPARMPTREEIVDAVKVAMNDAWADICSDSGCFPADIQRVGRGPLRLEYRPRIWTDQTAEMAASVLLALFHTGETKGDGRG